MQTRYVTAAETAKLVRSALKIAYPDTKFSVRSKVYAGGASIDIGWTDGPSDRAVLGLVHPFEGASFDGSVDLKSTVYHDVDGERVSYGADFIFARRQFSAEFLARAARREARAWGVEAPEILVDEYFGARLGTDPALSNGRRLSYYLYERLANPARSWCA